MIWPTPTPLPPLSTPQFLNDFDPGGFGQNLAGGVVNGWTLFDSMPFASLVWFILLALIILLGLSSIRHHLKDL